MKKQKKKKELVPVEMKDHSYLHERLDVLGWTAELNEFTTPAWRWRKNVAEPIPAGEHDYKQYTYQLFDADADGNLLINFYSITGAPATFKRGESPARKYVVTRYRNPMIGKDGRQVRFKGPSGTGALPWFGPRLIEAYRESTQIDCLVMTEGPIKAYAGELAGAYVVGIPGITQFRDGDKHLDQLHTDLVYLIQRCKPKKVVWLMDGDCKHFPSGWDPDTEDGREKDLWKRPNDFYVAIRTVRDLLQDLSNELGFSMWFKHVESDQLPRNPKGLDDVLVDVYTDTELSDKARAEAKAALVAELNATSGPGHYFYRKSLDRLSEIKRYFAIGTAQEFYSANIDRLKEHTFVFNGTKYRHDGKELVVVLPAVMRNYVRVGDTYYERVPVPNRFGVLDEKLHVRQKTTITDDHGKNMVHHIQKLKAFCNVPSHEDYQPIIANCWNRYQPIEHTPEPGDWPNIEMFLRHIFGSEDIEIQHPKKKDANGKAVMMRATGLDIGYDYMQLLFRRPTQILPILCLVSKDRETGKSTFGKLVKSIFTGNSAFVSSNDLSNDFNEHWISKLVVICEEAFLDKKQTIERIKDLSTASVAMLNSKGIQQQEIEVFLHFIINSNNTRNFITTDSDEIRFWVREIPRIPDSQKNPKLEQLMWDEIPAFLHFLSNRTMATEELSRMWFYPPMLETEALQRVRESSQPVVRRQLQGWMRTMLLATRADEIRMTADDIKREVFKGQGYDVDYVRRVIKEEFGALTVRNKKGDGPGTCAYSYYRWTEKRDPYNGIVQDIEEVKVRVPARPFVFPRAMFFSELDWELLSGEMPAMPTIPAPPTHEHIAKAAMAQVGGDDDMPF